MRFPRLNFREYFREVFSNFTTCEKVIGVSVLVVGASIFPIKSSFANLEDYPKVNALITQKVTEGESNGKYSTSTGYYFLLEAKGTRSDIKVSRSTYFNTKVGDSVPVHYSNPIYEVVNPEACKEYNSKEARNRWLILPLIGAYLWVGYWVLVFLGFLVYHMSRTDIKLLTSKTKIGELK